MSHSKQSIKAVLAAVAAFVGLMAAIMSGVGLWVEKTGKAAILLSTPRDFVAVVPFVRQRRAPTEYMVQGRSWALRLLWFGWAHRELAP